MLTLTRSGLTLQQHLTHRLLSAGMHDKVAVKCDHSGQLRCTCQRWQGKACTGKAMADWGTGVVALLLSCNDWDRSTALIRPSERRLRGVLPLNRAGRHHAQQAAVGSQPAAELSQTQPSWE